MEKIILLFVAISLFSCQKDSNLVSPEELVFEEVVVDETIGDVETMVTSRSSKGGCTVNVGYATAFNRLVFPKPNKCAGGFGGYYHVYRVTDASTGVVISSGSIWVDSSNTTSIGYSINNIISGRTYNRLDKFVNIRNKICYSRSITSVWYC